MWNSLPKQVIETKTVNTIKSQLNHLVVTPSCSSTRRENALMLYFIDVIKDFESLNHVGSQSSVLKWLQYKIFQAFKSIVGPHLEYGSNVWSVIYKKEAMQIENLQRRATTLEKIIQHLSYTERLKYLVLQSLQYRRLRAT
jgi:hypothetical protein